MDENQLNRSLQSIGMKCFVDYYEKFRDDKMSNVDLIELLMNNEGYKESGCKTRVSQSRRIIKAGMSVAAFKKIVKFSRLENSTLKKARVLLDSL